MVCHAQDDAHALSLSDPESFWKRHAEQLHWHREPSAVLRKYTKQLKSGVTHPSWTWFPDGELSTSFNCVERHVKAGRGATTAIAWDSPVSGEKEQISYERLLYEVETLAAILEEQGVRKGDVVLVYSMETLLAARPFAFSNHLGSL